MRQPGAAPRPRWSAVPINHAPAPGSSVGRKGLVARRAALAIAVAWSLMPAGPARAEGGGAAVVAVLGYHGSRLADEVKRELESSMFEVLSAEVGARRWQDVARTVDGGRLMRGVAVDENDRALTVYTRSPGRDTVEVRLVLSVDPADRMARRHACLSTVELLHALSGSETDLGPSVADIGASHAEGTGTRNEPRAGSASGPARAGTAPGPATATGEARPVTTPAASTSGTASRGSSAPGVTSPAPPEPPPIPPELAWQLGAAATFGVETNGGGPTSHLQLLGRIPATPHLALGARVLWPLLATQSRSGDSEVRAWSFGAAASLQYTLAPRRRLQPFFGLGVGVRLGITEITSTAQIQNNQVFPISGTLGFEAGVRYSLTQLVQVFFELNAARAWLVLPRHIDEVGRAAADGESARASVGVLFTS